MAFYDPSIFEVHVLLVDHDMNTLLEIARLLQFNSYKVTAIHDASIALSMLSQGNTKFNLVMVDVKIPNLLGFKLVHEAVTMDLPVIVMATSASPILVKCAIEDGAFLFMQKPTSSEELKYLWQHVLREITRKSKEKGQSYGETSTNYNYPNQNFYYLPGEGNLDVDKTNESVTMNPNVTTNKVTGPKRRGEIISFGPDNNNNNSNNNNNVPGPCMSMKPKLCTEWTPELHEKFMAAVKELGDGRCFPKDILELMNVPGLTRMQVASHLQKCRHGWQPSNERQGRRPKGSKVPNSSNPNQTRTKKYGIFPRLIRGSQPQFPPKDNQSNEQVPITMSNNNNNNNMEILMPISNNGIQIMEQQGTWNIINVSNNNINMNGTCSENAINGNILMAGSDDQGLQSDASFDFAAFDDGLIANNFNLNEFDYDHTVPVQDFSAGATIDTATTSDTAATAIATAMVDMSFWNSWIANFAREL